MTNILCTAGIIHRVTFGISKGNENVVSISIAPSVEILIRK